MIRTLTLLELPAWTVSVGAYVNVNVCGHKLGVRVTVQVAVFGDPETGERLPHVEDVITKDPPKFTRPRGVVGDPVEISETVTVQLDSRPKFNGVLQVTDTIDVRKMLMVPGLVDELGQPFPPPPPVLQWAISP